MRTLLLYILFLSITLCPVVLAAPADRFKGGASDGYARAAFEQTESVDLELINARFKGAGQDGYDKSILEDVIVRIPGGTVLMFR